LTALDKTDKIVLGRNRGQIREQMNFVSTGVKTKIENIIVELNKASETVIS
jgi:hypothetical protein